MTPEAQRIAIAEACGWKPKGHYWKRPQHKTGDALRMLPDFLNDLNAMHEAEKVLKDEQLSEYIEQWIEWNSTAALRAEAFLRTLNLWDYTK